MNALFARLLKSYTTLFVVVTVLVVLPVAATILLQGQLAAIAAKPPTDGPAMLISLVMSSCIWFAGILMCLVTLVQGPRHGAYLLPVLSIPSLAAVYYTKSSLIFLHTAVLKFGVAWLLAVVLMSTASWSFVIDLGCLIGFAVVLGYHYGIPDTAQYWSDVFHHSNNLVSAEATLGKEKTEAVLATLSKILTGFNAATAFFEVMTMLIAARWVQARLYNPGGLSKELTLIRCSVAVAAIALVTGIYALLGRPWAVDGFVVIIWPLILTGIVVLHSFANQKVKRPWTLIAPVWTVAICFPVLGMIIFATIAFVNVLSRFRTWGHLQS